MEESNLQQLPTNEILSSSHQSYLKKHVLVFVLFVSLLIIGVSFLILYLRPDRNPSVSSQPIATNQAQEPIQTKVLVTLPPGNPDIRYTFALDPYDHITAYRKQDSTGSKTMYSVVVNGVESESYEQVDDLTISPDGKRYAYLIERDDTMIAVIDGEEATPYEYITNLVFSNNGKHVAYAAGKGKETILSDPITAETRVNEMFIVLNGTELTHHQGRNIEGVNQETYAPIFNSDGSKLAYGAFKNNKQILMVDGEEFSSYSGQTHPIFAGPDDELVYIAQENGKDFVVHSGEKQEEHEHISKTNRPLYSNTANDIVAYSVRDNSNASLIVGDRVLPILQGGLHYLVFSDSGNHFAYYTGTVVSTDMFIDGERVGKASENGATMVIPPIFSPDDVYLAYGRTYYNADSNRAPLIKLYSIQNKHELKTIPLPEFRAIGTLRFSEDGNRIFFKALKDRDILYVTLNLEVLLDDI